MALVPYVIEQTSRGGEPVAATIGTCLFLNISPSYS